ncbi:hypothetical protein D1815_22955 [Aquimarina sp. AD1]|uniref:hypothetical protein n=1 Tax=Aquimarina TaxID=290174 RepID=UPI00041A84A2|nr:MULTISPECIES: hypothetical protein [Aquimarina]AXT58474.1 hypothetical protein D1815_22955 [Aquimarina sp. AD1]RKN16021.1 hypothetical protein D7035_15800 [Aquimarina sp. AD1]
MLKNILNVNGVSLINKDKQQSIKGGYLPECPTFFPGGCFAGAPFYCNIHGLPLCDPQDEEN